MSIEAAKTVQTTSLAAPPEQRSILLELLSHRLGAIGLIIISCIVLTALFAPLLMSTDPNAIDYDHVLSSPSWGHPLGTDEIGRDVLTRLAYGARVTVAVVVVSMAAAIGIGGLLGLVSGYLGGWVDSILMRIVDGMQAFPMLILALAIVSALGPSLGNAMIALAAVNVPRVARLVRGQTLTIRDLDYVHAAHALGAGKMRIMAYHIWPNVLDNIIVFASLRASRVILTEAAISFLGVGAQPPLATWGGMLTSGMQFLDAWWLSVFPGLAIFLCVLALNMLGDGLRDVNDVRAEK